MIQKKNVFFYLFLQFRFSDFMSVIFACGPRAFDAQLDQFANMCICTYMYIPVLFMVFIYNICTCLYILYVCTFVCANIFACMYVIYSWNVKKYKWFNAFVGELGKQQTTNKRHTTDRHRQSVQQRLVKSIQLNATG